MQSGTYCTAHCKAKCSPTSQTGSLPRPLVFGALNEKCFFEAHFIFSAMLGIVGFRLVRLWFSQLKEENSGFKRDALVLVFSSPG